MKQGDIVLVPFPYTNLSKSKIRPAIVISNGKHKGDKDLIVCEVTTTNRKKDEISIESSDFICGSLPKKSFVRPNKIATVHSRKVLGWLASLKSVKVCEVVNGLCFHIKP